MVYSYTKKTNFSLGKRVATKGASDTLEEIARKKFNIPMDRNLEGEEVTKVNTEITQIVINLIQKHLNLEKGVLNQSDHQLNINACKYEGQKDENGELKQDRIFSAFMVDDIKFWIITEWDRSATTILLPEEY